MTSPLAEDLNLDGWALVGGTLKRPNGTTAAAFDEDGGFTIYYPDGETIALRVSGDGLPVKLNTPDGHVLLAYSATRDALEFYGNNPLLLSSGGLDVNGYTVKQVADPETDTDAANKRYVDAAIAAALGTP